MLDEGGEGGIGVKTLFAATENGGVATLQAKDGAVDGDVGARFVDDADDADGDADLADTETVGTRGIVEDGSDGIGERDDFADGLREVGEAGGVEREAVERGRRECGGFGRGEIEGVSGEEGLVRGVDEIGELREGGVFRGRRGVGQHERRGAGALSEGGNEGDEFGGHGRGSVGEEGRETMVMCGRRLTQQRWNEHWRNVPWFSGWGEAVNQPKAAEEEAYAGDVEPPRMKNGGLRSEVGLGVKALDLEREETEWITGRIIDRVAEHAEAERAGADIDPTEYEAEPEGDRRLRGIEVHQRKECR